MLPGWLLEAIGNDGPRGMVIACNGETCCGNRTRLMGCFGQFTIVASLQGGMVTDLEMWQLGVARVEEEFTLLPPSLQAFVKERAAVIKKLKRGIHAFAEAMNGRDVCALCQGECCVTGKHHFTVIDLLVYGASGRPLFEPSFDSGLCPYLGDAGCLMEPEFRPFNCVTFNCERVGGLMEPLEKGRFHKLEQELVAVCRELERVFHNRFMNGLLINCERDLLHGKTAILRVSA